MFETNVSISLFSFFAFACNLKDLTVTLVMFFLPPFCWCISYVLAFISPRKCVTRIGIITLAKLAKICQCSLYRKILFK